MTDLIKSGCRSMACRTHRGRHPHQTESKTLFTKNLHELCVDGRKHSCQCEWREEAADASAYLNPSHSPIDDAWTRHPNPHPTPKPPAEPTPEPVNDNSPVEGLRPTDTDRQEGQGPLNRAR